MDSGDGLDNRDVSNNSQDLEELRSLLDNGEGVATNPAPHSSEASESLTAIAALDEVRDEYLSAGAEEGEPTEVVADDS